MVWYEVVGQVVWLKSFIYRLKVDNISKALTLYCHNEPAIIYSSNNKSSGPGKHNNMKYHVVKEIIQDQTISLDHISTRQMLIDPLTKRLTVQYFSRSCSRHGIIENPMILDVNVSSSNHSNND